MTKYRPKYRYKMIDVLEQACALHRIEPNMHLSNMQLKYFLTKSIGLQHYAIDMPLVSEQDKEDSQIMIEYFKRLLFNAIAGTLTYEQKSIYKALELDYVQYKHFKPLANVPYIYYQMKKDDWMKSILDSRLSGKIYMKNESPVIRKCLILSLKKVIMNNVGAEFWAYLAITDDDYFIQFTSSDKEPLGNERDEITIRGHWKENTTEYTTHLPITKLFRVKKL